MKRNYIADRMSKELNYLDKKVALEFYYALMRVVVDDLRNKGEFEFPDFGKFVVKEHKGRRMIGIRSKEVEYLPPIKTVKFSPNRKLKDFFKKLSQRK